MENFVVLLRGVNVSGKNLVNMKELKTKLLEYFQFVETYIQSGNILIQANINQTNVRELINKVLVNNFNVNYPILILSSYDFKKNNIKSTFRDN